MMIAALALRIRLDTGRQYCRDGRWSMRVHEWIDNVLDDAAR
ncbi:hypothetical protein [Planctomonas sp. JC2975]|nr:hypothetical protein [Planctomonas sp. JC2975]